MVKVDKYCINVCNTNLNKQELSILHSPTFCVEMLHAERQFG